jgi:hypothetical protein
MKSWALIWLLVLGGCVEGRVKRYQSLLNPMVGTAKKDEVSRLLGSPTTCTTQPVGERCEYRTAKGRNDPVPSVYEKNTLGPDLSPFEFYDVIQANYDGFGILKDWIPLVLSQ